MKVVYIAHPIGGDVDGNVAKVLAIVADINMSDDTVLPFAPYIVDVMALNDAIPKERVRGFKNNKYFFDVGLIDELWVYGMSPGVREEISWAENLAIPVLLKNPL